MKNGRGGHGKVLLNEFHILLRIYCTFDLNSPPQN